MDTAIPSLLPIHQIGADGFDWWIGQIESDRNEDPKYSNRYRVRIVGQHLKDCNKTKTTDLPWANVMLPTTTPYTDGGVTGASVGLKKGNWVVGFYLDNERQKPLIIGSIGHTAGATLRENVEKDPNPGGSCKSFTTFLDPDIIPALHSPLPEKQKEGGNLTEDSKTTTKVGEAGSIATAVPSKAPAGFYALFAEASPNNPIGGKVCVEIANPNCGSESDLKKGLQNILSEMLKASQDSGGQLGQYYVSKINGVLQPYVGVAREYITKATSLVKSFIARVKGEIVKLIKDGVDKLVDLILNAKIPDKDELGNVNTGPINPDLGIKPFSPITKKESRLKPVIDFFNEILDDVGCEMDGLVDKITQWLTDLLLEILMDVYTAATCVVDTLVNGILNQVTSFLEDVLSKILGPLDAVLNAIAAPLDILGNSIAKVLDLLGISCDGPGTQCQKVIKECVDCGVDNDEDWLDKLIDELRDGPLDDTSYSCEEAISPPATPATQITFYGGILKPREPFTRVPGKDVTIVTKEIPDDITDVPLDNSISYSCSDIEVTEGERAEFSITRSGNTTLSSSIKVSIQEITAVKGVDFIPEFSGGTIGFSPGETRKVLQFLTLSDKEKENVETFTIKLSESFTPAETIASFPDGKVFTCSIIDSDLNSLYPLDPAEDNNLFFPPSSVVTESIIGIPLTSSINPKVKTYEVSSDKDFYIEGETIKFTITTENVANNTQLSYSLLGDVDTDDIVGGLLTGVFTIQNNQAEVSIELVENNDAGETGEDDIPDPSERLVFSIDNTNAQKSVLIVDEEDTNPFYTVSANTSSVFEGETIVYTITTLNVPDNTIAYYTLSGFGIDENDIVENSLTGSFVIENNTATVEITVSEDSLEENTEVLTFTIDNTEASADVLIETKDEELKTEIVDTITPQFSVTTDKLQYKEGETIEYTIETVNVPDGTVLQYYMYGRNIEATDFLTNSLYGTFVIIGNKAVVYIGITDDTLSEENETVTFYITGTNAFADVIILSDAEDIVEKDLPISKPCLSPPTAGDVITDSNGSIISIPIIDTGCPYQKAPNVIITGSGYGSSAIALLDDQGKVSEVRVTRTGIGYKKNIAGDELKCIIDSFTLLNPGKGYTSEPDVYVDGKSGIAKAKINEDGFVYSVEIIDRSIDFKSMPLVKIIGGGGAGARVLPSIVCVDSKDLADKGYAKIGTGRYIDCP